jgi:hypothetical protein
MKNIVNMVLYKSWPKAGVVACFLFSILFISCNNGAANEAEEGTADTVVYEATGQENSSEDKVYYQVPSPDEMISFIKDGGFGFDNTVINSVDHLDSYVEQRIQAINLGIYTADLTYMAAYGQFQESMRYFNVVIKLAERLGISSAFDEALVGRVKNNLNDADSLELISRDSYYSIVDNLEQSQRGKTLAVIAAGGWLESMYVVLSLMDEYKADSPMLQRVADQKLVFENLCSYLKTYQEERIVSETLSDFKALQTAFNALDEDSTTTELKKTKGKRMVLGGKGKVNITKEQFDQLKQVVVDLRGQYTASNS